MERMFPNTTSLFDAPCACCGATPPLKIRQPERAERVEALLQTNGVPRDIERLGLEECARAAPPALLPYDTKIAALKEELELAVRERAKLQRHYEDAKTLLHPIRTLPSDVLREIFSWRVPTWRGLFENIKNDTFNYCSLNATNAPWSLSQVSMGWRTVALSSPLLWRTVALTVPDYSMNISKLGKLGFNLALLLSRSNNADLHVILECPSHQVKPVPFAVSIPLQISAPRWQALFYDANPILEHLLSDMHFDRLQGVDVRCSQRTKKSRVVPIRYAPQLRLVSILSGGTSGLREIAWSNLSDFQCAAPLLESDVKTLALMTNLVWLRLDELDDTTPICPYASIPLPKLRDLTLESSCFSTLFRFAVAFDAPLLTSLRLFYVGPDDPPAEIASIEVPEYMPRLDMLGLLLPLFSRVSDALAVWLRHALMLETLEVWCSSKEVADGSLFDKLVVKPDNGSDVLLPRIACLTIHTHDEKETLNDDARQIIVSIMESRTAEEDQRFSVLKEVTVNSELIVRDALVHAA